MHRQIEDKREERHKEHPASKAEQGTNGSRDTAAGDKEKERLDRHEMVSEK
jgi:hypothetical protein